MTSNFLGWVATATQTSSYLFRKAETVTKIQAGAALLWLTFGLLIASKPVVVANVIVGGAALFASLRQRRLKSPK